MKILAVPLIVLISVCTIAEESVDTSVRDASNFGDDALLAGLAPDGWTQSGEIEHYNVASLYEKINGRSELYMAYDVVGLSWMSLTRDVDPADFLDVHVYDMRTPTGAFGVYSMEREPDQKPIDFGRAAYQSGSNLYFWKGQHYGYINTSRSSDENTAAATTLLQKLIQRIPDNNEPVTGLDWLPETGLDTDSIQYFRTDAMGLDFFTDVFMARYTFGDDTAQVFVSKRSGIADAEQVVDQITEFGEKYADQATQDIIEETSVVIIEWGMNFHDAAFRSGPYVAGLSNVEGRDKLNRMLNRLMAEMRKTGENVNE